MTARDIARRALAAGTGAVALAYASAFAPASVAAAGAWLMAVAVPVVLVAATALGAADRAGSLRGLGVPFVLLAAWLAGGFGLVLGLPAEAVATPRVLGLPLRAAIVLYGVGGVPLVLLPLLYAWAFGRGAAAGDDLARVHAARRAPPVADP